MTEKIAVKDAPAEVQRILKQVQYGGRSIRFEETKVHPVRLESYWSGGSRDYYAAYRNGQPITLSVTTNPMGTPASDYVPEPGDILINRPVFQGKAMSATVVKFTA